ncbi:hypothetical protein HD806DRAFT_411073 [Xylariaceae sp. AK1471]|nr:hypothetical protein HD806DRAFT_411073 [Xylariaceae sp. AK1471]
MMLKILANQKEKIPPPIREGNVRNALPTQYSNVDSAVHMTFPESVKNDLANFEDSENKREMGSLKIRNLLPNHSIRGSAANSGSTIDSSRLGTPRMPPSVVNGMPYSFERLMEMGDALTKARRERTFPTTTTPTYNLQAVIDDYNDLQRLSTAREVESGIRDHAFRPNISCLYIEIQRRIQDRDITHGEVSADTNVHARLSGLANGTGAKMGIYDHTRNSVQSAFNHISLERESNIIDNVASRVTNGIRRTVEGQVIRGAYGVNEVNMPAVMSHVFGAIEDALRHGVGAQENRLDGRYNCVDGHIGEMSDFPNVRVDTIASHVHNSANGNVETSRLFNEILGSIGLSLMPPHDPLSQGPNPHNDGRVGGHLPDIATALDHLLYFIANPDTFHGAAVHSQEELDRIVANLIEVSPQSNAPAPAIEAAIASLQKKKLDEEMLGPELKGQCAICIEEVKVGDEVVVLLCKHWFHQECATLWLKQHNSCPVCRASIDGAAIENPQSADPSSPSRPTPTERWRINPRQRIEALLDSIRGLVTTYDRPRVPDGDSNIPLSRQPSTQHSPGFRTRSPSSRLG